MKLGPFGEKLGAKFLKRQGYRIVKRNYRCASGEIDIVAVDGDTLVFVEVKTRRSDEAADPEAAVNYAKRKQMTRVARMYLMETRNQNAAARFDVLSIVVPEDGEPRIEHFVDAFGPTPR